MDNESEMCTSGYMVRKELQREKLRGRAGMKAWGYEKKLGDGKGEAARFYWKDLSGRAKGGKQ